MDGKDRTNGIRLHRSSWRYYIQNLIKQELAGRYDMYIYLVLLKLLCFVASSISTVVGVARTAVVSAINRSNNKCMVDILWLKILHALLLRRDEILNLLWIFRYP